MRERLEQTWAGFNEREKRLVGILGLVAALLVVLMPVYLLSSAISALEEDNDAIESVLRDISHAGPRLAIREAEAEAAERRYDVRAPALGSFVEAQCSTEGVAIQSVTNQPEVQEGRYRRRHVRAQLPGATLRSAVHLLHSIEGAPYPIALERIHVEHFTAGEDRFNFEIGVITYDRTTGGAAGASGEDAGVPRTQPPGHAGPPAP
ncbi:MAG: type II secretion system protein GspM [Sandaracinus sp.]